MSQTYRTREQWQELIVEFEQSGLTQKDFCEQRGLNPAYFGQRRLRLQREVEESDTGFCFGRSSAPRFAAISTVTHRSNRVGVAAFGVTTLGGAVG